MKTKIQIKSVFGKILFEYESEDNSLKKTVEEAVKQNKDLSYANLSGAHLFGAHLSRANLTGATLFGVNLSYADLFGATLFGAHLFGANLFRANLSEAYLSEADLSSADLSGANLSEADLSGAHLSSADLSSADLTRADLTRAYLYGANLYIANLYRADFYKAYLFKADLSGAVNIPFIPLDLPEGEFIAYKKIKNVIVKLKILEDSKRSRATGNKCRCDKALVLEFQDLDGNKLEVTEIVNNNYATCTYKVGEIVEADKWDDNRWLECSHGIHFFLDRQIAVGYEH